MLLLHNTIKIHSLPLDKIELFKQKKNMLLSQSIQFSELVLEKETFPFNSLQLYLQTAVFLVVVSIHFFF